MTSGLAKRVAWLAAASARPRPGSRVWSRTSPTLSQAVTLARAYTPASPNPLQSAIDPAKDKTIAYSTFECSAEACSAESRQQTPLIIQHSLFGRKENCKILGKELHHLTRRRVILPDARNHGDSPPCKEPSVRQMSSDLAGLQAQLGLPRACLMGFSTGGRVAMVTALTRPNTVDRLVVVASSPLNTADLQQRWERHREACYIVHTFLANSGRLLPAHSLELAADIELKLDLDTALKSTSMDKTERSLFISNLGKVNMEYLLNSPDLGRFPSMQDKVFHGPTLFITGEKRPVWEDDQQIRSIRHMFPNSHFVKIAGAGHCVHTEKQDDFLSAVIPFLQSEL